jgi:uncharacterized protein YuzB (UPF0349 family)
MILSNLAANVETRAAATRSGGLQAAILMMKDDDGDVKKYSCIALCNMANNPTTQSQAVVHGCLPPLLLLAGSGDPDSQRHSASSASETSAKTSLPFYVRAK